MKTRNDALVKWFYDLIRPLFVRGWNKNEDFNCGLCDRPVLRRYLYCSSECSEIHEKEIEDYLRRMNEIARLKRIERTANIVFDQHYDPDGIQLDAWNEFGDSLDEEEEKRE